MTVTDDFSQVKEGAVVIQGTGTGDFANVKEGTLVVEAGHGTPGPVGVPPRRRAQIVNY